MSGVTSAGFERKTLAEITADVDAALKVKYGPDVDLTSGSNIGKLKAVFIDKLSEHWMTMEDMYYALYPDTAEGVNLERVAALGGLSRQAAVKAAVELEIFGTAGTAVPLAFQGQTAGGVAFETTELATIAAVEGFQEISSSSLTFSGSTVPLIAANTYDLDVTIDGGGLNQLTFILAPTQSWDDVMTLIQTALQTATGSTETVSILGGAIRITSATTGASSVVLIAAGTAGSGGGDILAYIDASIANMTTTIETAVDGSAGRVDVDARAVVAGADGNVSADTITTIGTPTAGITSVNNREAATLGAPIETDAELRLRYQSLGGGGSSAVAIQSQLNALDSVITAKVYENNTDAIDGDGLPAHSIQAVVDGGTDEEIGTVLLNYKAAGIETYGGNSATVVDSEGISRTFKFDRPTSVTIWVDVDITSNSDWDSTYAVTVKARVAEIVGGTSGGVTYPGNGIGADVYSWQILANLAGIQGIDEVNVDVENVSPPTQEKHVIARAERATTTDANIVVTVI